MKYLIWLSLVGICFAQTQGNRPDLIDSFQSGTIGSSTGQIVWPDNVAIGDELVVCIDIDSTQPTPTVTDSLANTWTMTSPTLTPLPQATRNIYMAYANSSSAGADTISAAISGSGGVQYTMSAGRFSHLSGAVDGSVATTTYTGNGSGGPGSFNTSITTTVNNDLLVSCAGNSGFGTSFVGPATGSEYISVNNEFPGALNFEAMQHTGALGSYTPTFNTYNDFNFGSHATFAAQTIAFKPTPTIAIVDTALPDAANGVAYSAQLHCVGGTAGQTYSLFSGSFPAGISLNTSTGVISGTTTSVGTSALQFKCTDGTSTSAAQALTLNVDTFFTVPSVRQAMNVAGNMGSPFVSPVACGDVIAVFLHGMDTHGSNGWVQAAANTNNNITDSFGTVFSRLGPISGSLNAPIALYIGQVLSSGIDTVTLHINANASGLNYTIADISGVQKVVDIGTFSNAGAQASSPFSFTNSLTSVAPNELLFVASSTGYNSGELISYSPLSVQLFSSAGCCYDVSALGWTSLSSASSYTATATVTSGQPRQSFPGLLMQAFRPGVLPAVCQNFVGQGEKIKKVIF